MPPPVDLSGGTITVSFICKFLRLLCRDGEINMEKINTYRCVCLAVFMMGMLPLVLDAADVPRMDKDELKKLLDNPDVIILDVRTRTDWDQNTFKIKGARRLDNVDAVDGEVTLPKDKTLVLYCS
jgi:hypothetical protein